MTRTRMLSAALGLLLIVASTQISARSLYGDFTAGITLSSDYQSLLQDAYPEMEISGGNGWLELGGALRYQASSNFQLALGADIMVNAVSGADSFSNKVVTPKLRAQWNFRAGPSPYLAAELNRPDPETGSDRFELENDGLGFGVAAGFMFRSRSHLELGYRHLPVQVSSDQNPDLEGERNLGGPYFRFIQSF